MNEILTFAGKEYLKIPVEPTDGVSTCTGCCFKSLGCGRRQALYCTIGGKNYIFKPIENIKETKVDNPAPEPDAPAVPNLEAADDLFYRLIRYTQFMRESEIASLDEILRYLNNHTIFTEDEIKIVYNTVAILIIVLAGKVSLFEYYLANKENISGDLKEAIQHAIEVYKVKLKEANELFYKYQN